MKENTRVKMSIILWIAVAMVFIYCGIYVYNNINPEPATTAVEESAPSLYFDKVADECVASGEFAGVAIAISERNGDSNIWSYGSLANMEDVWCYDIAELKNNILLLQHVEQGSITLAEALSADVDSSIATLNEATYIATMVLDEGVVNDEKVLSKASIKTLLTPAFGWDKPSYMSLLSPDAVEFCTSNCAIIVDNELGIAIVIVVDNDASLGGGFATLRSRIASIAAASVVD